MEEEKLINETQEETEKKPKKTIYSIFGGKYGYVMFLISLVLISSAIAIRIYSEFCVDSTSQKLDQINALVREYYSGEIDDEAMDDMLASAYMKAIDDKYGFYRNSEDAEEVEASFEGNTSGIGVTVFNDEENNALAVFRVDNGSPAYKAGIQNGDKIIAVDDKTVEDEGFSKSVDFIKREIGQSAKITLLRDGETLDFTVKYEDFVRQSVYYEVVQNYAYVTITAFNEATVTQFKQTYNTLIKDNVKGIIFDVRDNGGGTVDSVCEILDVLVAECDLITIKYADGSEEISHKSDAQKCELPMVVLTNGSTASAAELFSANLRDMAKALLIGNNTYGKGVVQRTYFLTDGSCVRFTVGEFLPAGGEGFNEKGLAPDFEVEFTEEQLKNRYALGENDPYLKKAVEQLNAENSKGK